MKLTRIAAAIALAAAAVVVVSGCSSSGYHAEGSRHELFDSVRSLAAASSTVVLVEVVDQRRETDPIPATVSTVTHVETFTPEGLATALGVEPTKPRDQLVVRQVEVRLENSPYPTMAVGERYLLFLTPSMLDGEQADQFYVTGGSAGVYAADGNAFVHGPFEEGDELPEKLTAEDLR